MNSSLVFFLSLVQLGANAKDPQHSSIFTPFQSYSQFNRQVESTYNVNNCLQSTESLANCLNKNKDVCEVSCAGDLPLSVESDCDSIQAAIASFGECCPSCATEANDFAQCYCACTDIAVSYSNCTILNECQTSCAGKVPEKEVESCTDFESVIGSTEECCSSCAPDGNDLALCFCALLELTKISHATSWTFAPGILVSIFLFTQAF